MVSAGSPWHSPAQSKYSSFREPTPLPRPQERAAAATPSVRLTRRRNHCLPVLFVHALYAQFPDSRWKGSAVLHFLHADHRRIVLQNHRYRIEVVRCQLRCQRRSLSRRRVRVCGSKRAADSVRSLSRPAEVQRRAPGQERSEVAARNRLSRGLLPVPALEAAL